MRESLGMTETNLPVEHLFTAVVNVEVSGMIPNGPAGTRLIVNAPVGTFEGERLRGTTRGPGGDWVVIRANGVLQLDVRLLLETHDGAVILMTYGGIGLEGGKKLRTAPRFETGDERYAWLNDIQAISTGVSGDGKVTYEVYEVK